MVNTRFEIMFKRTDLSTLLLKSPPKTGVFQDMTGSHLLSSLHKHVQEQHTCRRGEYIFPSMQAWGECMHTLCTHVTLSSPLHAEEEKPHFPCEQRVTDQIGVLIWVSKMVSSFWEGPNWGDQISKIAQKQVY